MSNLNNDNDVNVNLSEKISSALNRNLGADVGEIVRESIAKSMGELKKPQEQEVAYIQETAPELSMAYVLSRLDKILGDNEYIHRAIESISGMNSTAQFSDQGKSEAIAQTVEAREKTNQQMVKLLERMYDDLKQKGPSLEDKKIELITQMMNNKDLTYEDRDLISDLIKNLKPGMSYKDLR